MVIIKNKNEWSVMNDERQNRLNRTDFFQIYYFNGYYAIQIIIVIHAIKIKRSTIRISEMSLTHRSIKKKQLTGITNDRKINNIKK